MFSKGSTYMFVLLSIAILGTAAQGGGLFLLTMIDLLSRVSSYPSVPTKIHGMRLFLR